MIFKFLCDFVKVIFIYGMLEYWNTGILEYWNTGNFE